MIATVLVTHDRLDYTRRTLESLLEHRPPDHLLVVFDNASEDETPAYLESVAEIDLLILSPRNLFPGGACNRGFAHATLDWNPTLLHRSDNDVEYQPGWWQHVLDAFDAFPKLGLFGLLNMQEDFPDGQPVVPLTADGVTVNGYWPSIGGNHVWRRELWDAGVRYKPGPWQPGGQDEDKWLSWNVADQGFFYANTIRHLASNISFGRYQDFPGYYDKTAALRGLVAETSV